jgi:hypothetical protein
VSAVPALWLDAVLSVKIVAAADGYVASYSAACGASSGSGGFASLLAFSDDATDAETLSRRKSTIKSRKHSTGTEYVLSAVEYFVRNEITILSSAAE